MIQTRTFEDDSIYAESLVPKTLVILENIFHTPFERVDLIDMDFRSINIVQAYNDRISVEAKYRRSDYGDFLMEFECEYLATGVKYKGCMLTQNALFLLYMTPIRTVVLHLDKLKRNVNKIRWSNEKIAFSEKKGVTHVGRNRSCSWYDLDRMGILYYDSKNPRKSNTQSELW